MASGIYNRFKANVMNKLVDVGASGDTLKIALLNNTHAFNADHDTFADVSANQITGTGYTAGGETLANQAVAQDDTNDRATLDADDVSWTSASFMPPRVIWIPDSESRISSQTVSNGSIPRFSAICERYRPTISG